MTYALFAIVFLTIIIPSLEKMVMDRKRETIREMTQFGWSILAQYDEDVKSGEMTLEEAKVQAIRTLEGIRYGRDNLDYFWINDDRPYFIMHPFRNDLVGKEITDISDNNIKEALSKIHEVAELHGEGYLEYIWQWKNNPLDIGPKISYVKKYEPWGWTVGTGMYIDDVNRETALLKARFRFSASLIFFIAGGLLAFIIYQNFIDEQKKIAAQNELLASQKKYRDLVQSANSAILRMDKTGNVTFINEYAQRFFGYSKEEILGQNVLGTIVPRTESSGRDLEHMIANIVKHPEIYELNENENVRRNGECLWITWTNKAIYDNEGNLIEILSIGNDITALKAAEERSQQQQKQLIQADKMASLGILVSGVAHEVNNPNQMIMGNASVLKKIFHDLKPVHDSYYKDHGEYHIGGFTYDELSTQIPDMFSDILSGSTRIKYIVQELRDFARYQPDELTELVDINAIAKSAVILVTNMINKATGNFTAHYGNQIPLISGHFQRLEQVIINVLQNACQALENSSQKISLSTVYDAENNVIQCVLKDEGVGMNEEILKHAADPFFTTKRESGATGLGLSISSKIIDSHGGSLTFESIPGNGTTAVLRLPVNNGRAQSNNETIGNDSAQQAFNMDEE